MQNITNNRLISLLKCPECGCDLLISDIRFLCVSCGLEFSVVDGVPIFNIGSSNKITRDIREFYNKYPFPGYANLDSVATLMERARKSIFGAMLDKQIPYEAKILDVGCGTGQMSIFLSLANRFVVGADLAINSLLLGNNFKRKHDLQNVSFVESNIFHLPFKEESFDFVYCNGVLHHTSDCQLAFEGISRLVKPGGYVIIGLYHRFSRLLTDLRRFAMKRSGFKFDFLDPRHRKSPALAEKRMIWLADQYQNPHETKHTIKQLKRWFDLYGFDYIRSIPGSKLFSSVDQDTQLFEPEISAGGFELSVKEHTMTLTNSKDGGLFIIIGKKKQKVS